MPSGDVIIYTRHYMSAGSRGNIVQDIPCIHYVRKRRGRGVERGGRRSMASFYYRDHLFVNIIYTLRGGGSTRHPVLNTMMGEGGREGERGEETSGRVAFRYGGRFFACLSPFSLLRNHFRPPYERRRALNEPFALSMTLPPPPKKNRRLLFLRSEIHKK